MFAHFLAMMHLKLHLLISLELQQLYKKLNKIDHDSGIDRSVELLNKENGVFRNDGFESPIKFNSFQEDAFEFNPAEQSNDK